MARRGGAIATRRAKARSKQMTTVAVGPGAGLVGSNPQPGSERSVEADAVEPEALVFTHGFDSGEDGEPYSAILRFTGRRMGVHGRPQASDSFVQEQTVDGIVPGTGPVSVTTWVYGLHPGEWTVSAEPIRISSGATGSGSSARPRRSGGRPVYAAAWSWRRWALSSDTARPIRTRWALLAQLARIPAVMPGIYTALAVLGVVVALASLAALLATENVSVSRALAAALLALVSGLIGAKVWYAILHPRESVIRGGWAVDGFLVVAPVVAAAALIYFDLPIGVVLDASSPGLFFAVAIGRIGCFFSGCCAGRCTASRWGVWSSDRHVGARRIPTQLLESAAGLLLGLAALLLVLGGPPSVRGAIFVGAFAAYAVVRQLLLRLRSEQRASARTIPLTAGAIAFVVLVVVAMSLVQTGGTPALG